MRGSILAGLLISFMGIGSMGCGADVGDDPAGEGASDLAVSYSSKNTGGMLEALK
jgi:hypothetical protein